MANGSKKLLLLNNRYREDQVAWADIVNNILALDNLTEAGMHTVKVLRIAAVVADEELRAARILTTMSH